MRQPSASTPPAVRDSMPRSPSLAAQAYERLEGDIVMGRLAPGRMLTEPELSERLGIGRTPVREALQRLRREGLVRVLPRHGVQVTELDVAAQLEWVEVRRVLERLVAGNAARRADARERKRMLAIARALTTVAERGDIDEFMHLDHELHGLIETAAGNAILSEIMHLNRGRNRRFWYLLGMRAVDLKRSAQLHVDILRAIATGNEQRAGDAATALLDDLVRVTQEILLKGDHA